MRTHRKMICVDSRAESTGSIAEYTIKFNKINNIVGIDMITAEIPATQVDDFYVYVGLETYGSMESNEGLCDIFAKVSIDGKDAKYTNVTTVGKIYDTLSPLPSLSSLRIWIKNREGDLVLFATPGSPNSFTIMITYLA